MSYWAYSICLQALQVYVQIVYVCFRKPLLVWDVLSAPVPPRARTRHMSVLLWCGLYVLLVLYKDALSLKRSAYRQGGLILARGMETDSLPAFDCCARV